MKTYKKLIYIFTTIALVITLVACDLKNLVDIEVNLLESSLVIMEGEELPTDKFEVIGIYSDGSRERLDFNRDKLRYDYDPNPVFDHFDAEDNLREQMVKFMYNNKHLVEVPIYTKRLTPTDINVISYGKTAYQYGQMFEPDDYQLLVRFEEGPNKIVDLDLSMVDLPSNLLIPEVLGTYETNIYYNGLKAGAPIRLNISKADQVLDAHDIQLKVFTKDKIVVEPIENAVYAFYPANNIPSIKEFQIENEKNLPNIATDYVVFVKLLDNQFYNESEVVSKTFKFAPSQAIPNVLFVNEETVIFEHQPNFDIVIIENGEFVKPNPKIVSGMTIIDGLLPNHSYQFGYVEKNTDILYDSNILNELVVTKPANDVLKYNNTQQFIYSSVAQNFNYSIAKEYEHLQDALEVDIKYFQNGELTSPIDVGVYDVEITYNFSREVFKTKLVVTPKDLTVYVDDTSKVYGDADPLFTLDVSESFDSITDFDYNFTRVLGENIGTYTIDAEVTNPNYNITVIPGQLEITPRTVVVDIDNQTQVYDDEQTLLTYTLSEEVYRDQLDLELTIPSNSNVGSYDITATTSNPNFNIEVKMGTYEITPRPIDVTIDNKVITYEDSNVGLTYQLSEEAYRSELGLTITRETGNAAGTYVITATTSNPNFKITVEAGTYTIEPKVLEVTINNQTKIYGESDPTFSVDLNGAQDPLVAFNITYNRVAGEDVGTYVIEASVTNPNYDITVIAGALEITPRPITAILNNRTQVYGDAAVDFTYTLSEPSYDAQLDLEVSRILGHVVGTYTITATTSNPNFNLTVVDGVYTITPRTLTVTDTALTSTYNKENQTLSVNISNNLSEDDVYAYVIDTTPNVGTRTLTIQLGGADKSNYILDKHTIQTTIQPRDLTIMVEDKVKVYGNLDPANSIDLGDSLDPLTSFIVDYTRQSGNQVGTYTIDAVVTNPNYNITVIPGQLEITPRPIDVTIDNKVITYEDSNVALTYQLSEEAYRSELGLTITRETGNAAGTYVITATTSNPNFEITVEAGTYTIEPKVLEVTINNQTKIYGESDPTFSVDLNGAQDPLVAFNITYDREVGESVDTYTITAEITNPNYDITVVAGALEITPRALTVQVNNETKVYGEDDPLFTLDLNNSLDSLESFSVTYDREVGEDVGTYVIEASVTNPNYNITVIGGHLTITQKELEIEYTYPLTPLVYGTSYTITANANLAFDDQLRLSNHTSLDVGQYVVDTRIYDEDNREVTHNYYVITAAPTYEIIARKLIVSANEIDVVYGTENISRRLFTVEGLQYGESADDIITGQLSFDNYEGEVGHYDISLGTLEVDSNYELEFTPNTLTVRKRDLTLNYVGDMSVTYGTPFDVTTEIQEGSILTNHEIILTGLTSRVVGTYQISATIYDENNNDVTHNYNITNATFEFEITKKVLDVTFEYANRYVGQTNDQILYGLTVTGFAYGETVNVLGNRNNIVVSTNADNTSPAGTYDIEVVTGYTSNNYDFNYEVGALMIRQISLLFEFDNILVTYDAQTHSVDITNIVIKDPITDQILDNEQFIDDIEFIYTQSGVNKSPVNVGTYNITLIFNGNIMYEAATHTGNTLEIQPRDLTVKVEDKVKVYGDDDPANSIDLGDSLDPLANFTVDYTRQSGNQVGTYTIDAVVTNPNYNITVIPGQLEITPRPIDVTIDNKVITYEDSNVALTYQLSEETYRSELGLIITRETGNAAGTYAITATTSNPNFEITVEAGTYTIEPKVLEVTINNQTKIYGESDPTFSVDLNGAQDPLVAFNITYNRVAGEDVGTYVIEASVTNPNYDITVVAGALEITPRPITAILNNRTQVYGDAAVDFTYTLSEPSYDAQLDLEVTRTLGHAVGTYTITATTSNPNFNLTVVDGVYTITPRTLTVTDTALTSTYNKENQTLSVNISNNLSEDDVYAYVVDTTPNVGTRTLTIQLGGADKSNYNLDKNTIQTTIQPRDLTIMVEDKVKVYGNLDPANSIDLGDSLDPLTSFTVDYTRQSGNQVGTYTIDAVVTNPNYNITVIPGQLKITPRPIDVTIDNKVITYEDSNVALTYQLSEEAYRSELGLIITRETGNAAGTYAITATTSNPNFEITVEAGTYTIEPKVLEVTINNQTKIYGEDDPTFSVDLNGAQDPLVAFNITYNRVAGEDVGTYVIEASVTNPNYDITVVAGTFEITPRALTVQINNEIKVYGEDDPLFTLDLNNSLDPLESFSVTYDREVGEDVGTYAITAEVINPNYNITVVDGVLEITPRPITVTVHDKTQTYGDTALGLTYTLSEPVYDAKLDLELSRTSGNNVGTYSITATTMNSNFDLTVISGTYTIIVREISVTYSGYTGLTYNGQAHDILAVATNLADGDLLQLAGHDASDAGTYTATAYVYKDGVDVSNNYQITDQSIEYTIAKRTITASLLETEFEYTGQDVDLEVSLTGLISGDDLYVTIIGGGQSVGPHKVNVELNGEDQDNYELLSNEFTITITKGTLQLESNVDKVISGMQVFEYDYLNNNTTISNATLLEILGLSHLSGQSNDPVFTGLDLSNGASTFIVDVTIPESTNYKSLETTFILKLKTVSVGTGVNPTYYTIEDALLNTSSGTLVVRYHTSFAQSDVAHIVYGTNNFDLESGVTLLLPYNSEYSLGTNDDTGQTANAPKIDRNNVYVNLTLTENTVLYISGKMIVNAQFTGGTPYAGYVTGANYSILNLNNNSKVNVLSDGSLYSNGFIIGSGKVEVFNGAKVYERLYIMRFRGGSITSAIYGETFPFDEFGFNNIESELIINKGGSLYAGVIVHVEGFRKSNLLLIGDSNALLNLNDNNSRIIKKYDISSGKTTFDLYGKITMSDVSVTLAVTAKTENKDFPFPGNFSINVKENANFTLDMRVKLLPGSKVHVEEGADVTITKNGSLMIYDGNQYYPGEGISYATSAAYDRFRVSPTTIGYSLETPAKFINDGYVKVEGRIAGKVTSSKDNLGTLNGIIELGTNSNSITVKSFNHSTGSSIFTTAYYDEITYYLLDYKNTVINGNNIYQVHRENEPWTIAMNFHNLDTNETTVINQPYGEKYIYPDWYNGEIMEIYADNQLLDPIGEDFNNKIVEGTIITDVYVKEVIKHTVNFEPNGGEDLDIIYVTDGDNIDLIYYTTIKSNHIFMGWYIDSDFNQKYTNQPILTDITLYAKWIEGTPVITLSGPTLEVENNADVVLTATVETQDGTPIEGVEVIFSMNPAGGSFTSSSGVTNSNGVVTTTFSGPGEESYTLTATESITGEFATITVNVKPAPSSGSPFLYSIDADGNLHFEHEPISHSMLKTVESATYGTLRLLESIDGKYYIEVVEEGESITMLNGLNLYYFDYVEDSDIIDFFVDVNGHPHTIKERIAPTSFVDQNGQSYLYEVTHKDNEFATFNDQVTTPVGYYYMTFDRPNTNNAKFMITTKDNSGTLDAFYDVMSSFNAYRNLWWLEEVFMNSASDTQAIQNIFDTLLIQVEVWNGSEWVNQGSIQRGSYLLEEFLLELDLAGIHTEDLQVRISMPTNAGYIIDSVAVDYSQNAAFTYGTMTLDTALFNYDTDVLALVQNDMDDLYAQLNPQDRVRFGFTAPELASGYTRSYGVKMSGYIYAEGLQLEDELIPLMDGKSFEEIKQIIIDSGRADLIADLPMVEEFYYSIIFLGHMDREIITEYLFNTSE